MFSTNTLWFTQVYGFTFAYEDETQGTEYVYLYTRIGPCVMNACTHGCVYVCTMNELSSCVCACVCVCTCVCMYVRNKSYKHSGSEVKYFQVDKPKIVKKCRNFVSFECNKQQFSPRHYHRARIDHYFPTRKKALSKKNQQVS